jgi:hypothetical protein
MGYTHYYPQQRDFAPHEWAELTAITRWLLANLPPHSTSAGGCFSEYPLAIRGWDGEGEPEINGRVISFNGDGDLAHETFCLARRGYGFQFCKTARKPYDLIVCAVLLAAMEIAPGTLDVSSDGEIRGEGWQPARDFLRTVPPPQKDKPMLTNVTYNRSERRYEVDCDGRLLTFSPGVDGRQAAFRAGVEAQNPALYELAAKMVIDNPAIASRVWRACQIVLEGGVNLNVSGTAVATVASQSSAYGDYVLQASDGLIACDCEDFAGGTAVYTEGSEQPYCKHILAFQFALCTTPELA